MFDGDVETSHEGYCSRVGKSFMAALVGLLLFLASPFLLWWNEGHMVHVVQALDEASKSLIEVDCSKTLTPSANNHLIHISCDLDGLQVLHDPSASWVSTTKPVAWLKRSAEMYQWVEESHTEQKKDKVGGGTTTVTTYSYHHEWSAKHIDTGRFHHSFRCGDYGTCRNPQTWPLDDGQRTLADTLFVGAFLLNNQQVTENLKQKEILHVDVSDGCSNQPPHPPTRISPDNTCAAGEGWIITGADPYTEGDMRVKWETSTATSVSVLAQQTSDGTFATWKAKSGIFLQRITEGKWTADEMIAQATTENIANTWMLRGLGWLMAWGGLWLVTTPLTTIPDIVPFIGPWLDGCASCMIGAVMGLASLCTSLCTISVAWLAYRPLIAVPLLIVAGGIAFFAVRTVRANKQGGYDAL